MQALKKTIHQMQNPSFKVCVAFVVEFLSDMPYNESVKKANICFHQWFQIYKSDMDMSSH